MKKRESKNIVSKMKRSEAKTIYELQAEICSALASPVRLHILDLLNEGEKTVGELQNVLKVPKANLSQHISVLKDVGVIHARKEGLYQYISISVPKIKDACSLVRSVLIEKIEMEEKKRNALMKELKSQK